MNETKSNEGMNMKTNRIYKAAQLLKLGTVQYTIKRVKGFYRPVTDDGKVMGRFTYVDCRSKVDLRLQMARMFGAEVYGDMAFVNLRTAMKRHDLWAGDRLSGLFAAAPVKY